MDFPEDFGPHMRIGPEDGLAVSRSSAIFRFHWGGDWSSCILALFGTSLPD